VPNGNIQVVSNKSRGWARAIVDTRFAYGQDPEQVSALIDELFVDLREDEHLREWVKDGPIVLGVDSTSDTGVVIRAVAETLPSKRFDVERLLRERITQRLAERGIRAPLPSPTAPRPPDSL
jgi:small conductance mechanosensitive channel